MKAKAPKVYTLAQVKKLLRKGTTTIYTYVHAGLIKVVPGKATAKSGRPQMVVPEAEFERLKRNGVDSTGIKAKMTGKPPKRSTSGKAAAKKPPKRKTATAAPRTATKKKSAKRSATHPTRGKR
jgi:hypothetical protein